MASFELIDSRGSRTAIPRDFPLAVGGGSTEGLRLPGEDGEPVAWLGLDAGDLFVQPADGRRVTVDGDPIREARWLQPGDVVTFPSARLLVEAGEVGPRLRVVAAAKPILTPPRATRPSGDAVVESPPIEAVDFRPARDGGRPSPPRAGASGSQPVITRPPRRHASSPLRWVLLVPLAILAVVAWYLFTARSVAISIEPKPDQWTLDAFPPVDIGGRRLLRPGRYPIYIEKEGYRTLDTELVVGSEAQQTARFTLEKLPGRLVIHAVTPDGDPVADARVLVGGEAIDPGERDQPLVELPAGEHAVRVEADRYRPFETVVSVAGAGIEERVDAVLEPRWATVAFTSEPAGARITVDGESIGRTPITAELVEGVRRFQVTLARHRPYRGKVEVRAGEDASVPSVRLRPSDGNLVISSQPSGATVTVAGRYRGVTPLDIAVAPGSEHVVQMAKAGFASAERRVELTPDGSEEVHVDLDPLIGTVRIAAFPPDAELWIDGERRGDASQTLELPVRTYQVAIKKPGHVPHEVAVTPVPDVPQVVEIELETVAEAREKTIKPVLETVAGELRRVAPGRFGMGASRREPGRRANETLREIELTRRFYVGAREVTNAEFRRFRPNHDSGTAGGHSLALDDHPVVRVTWQDAVAYCNWLSAREGLAPAYVEIEEDDGQSTFRLADPPTLGYRLPTEAEWAWLARYPDGPGEPRKYPWGASLPIPSKAGNFADTSASEVLPGALGDYTDGHPTTAAVDAYPPDARGLRQLGGNVAEWVHDVYVLRPPLGGAIERDPVGPPRGALHSIRGSSWMHSTITELRLSFRDYGKDARPDVGFRVARWIDPITE
ncbi:MAG: PEGA domain-containing protein [Acidobacteriota bacterium]